MAHSLQNKRKPSFKLSSYVIPSQMWAPNDCDRISFVPPPLYPINGEMLESFRRGRPIGTWGAAGVEHDGFLDLDTPAPD